MTFGSQTVKFITITDGTPDRNNVATPVRTPVTVSGCRFRPLTFREKVDVTDVATEIWKLTAPADAGALAAESVDEVVYDGSTNPADVAGNRFQIVGGVQPFNDMGSTVFKVTVLCQKTGS